MTIRNKLTFQFTALAASVLLLFCILIYYVSMVQIRSNFYSQLYDRTTTTAYIYLEEDELHPDLYETIRRRYVRTLPSETAQMYDLNNNPAFLEPSDEIRYDDEMVNYIRTGYTYPDYYAFRSGKVQSAGLFYPDNQGDFVVIVSAVDAIGRSQLNNLAWTLGFGFFLSLIVLFYTGRLFATQALKPIPDIVRQVHRISASNLHVRLDESQERDELGELVATFNRLLDRLESNFKIQSRFVANASHELRTPLTSIIGEIEVALSRPREAGEYRAVLELIHTDANTLNELTTSLLEMARTESETFNGLLEPIRIDELVLEAGMQIEKTYPEAVISVNYSDIGEDHDSFLLPANRSLLLNAFINVFDNAIKFSPDNHQVDVTLSSSRERIEVQIRDYGIGIPEEDLERVYDPFYRSRQVLSSRGYGIGLSLVKRVLAIVRGEIRITSTPGEGSLATITFHK